MQQLKKSAALILGLMAASAMAATSIDKLTLNPPSGAKVGDKVTATVDFADVGEGICGIELEFGDGRRDLFKIKSDTKLPIVVEHTYKAAGEQKVRVAGTRVENALGCAGKQIAMYQVAAAPAAAPKGAAASQCPAEWTLKGKVARNGGFTCVPAKGVKSPKKPEKGLECPAGTSYFTKGKTLGCEAG